MRVAKDQCTSYSMFLIFFANTLLIVIMADYHLHLLTHLCESTHTLAPPGKNPKVFIQSRPFVTPPLAYSGVAAVTAACSFNPLLSTFTSCETGAEGFGDAQVNHHPPTNQGQDHWNTTTVQCKPNLIQKYCSVRLLFFYIVL